MGKKLRNATLGLTMAGIVAGGLTSCSETENKQPTKKNNKTEQFNTEERNKKMYAMHFDIFAAVFDDATSCDITTNENGSIIYVAEYKLTPEQKKQASEQLKQLEKLKTTILEKENPKLHQAAREGNLQAVKAALERGADINSVDQETGQTAIQEALSCPNFAKASRVVSYLAESPQIKVGQNIQDEIKDKILNGDVKWQSLQDKVSRAKKTRPTVLEQINDEIEQTEPFTKDIKLYGAYTPIQPHKNGVNKIGWEETFIVSDQNRMTTTATLIFEEDIFSHTIEIKSKKPNRDRIRNVYHLNNTKFISRDITWEEALRNQQQASR